MKIVYFVPGVMDVQEQKRREKLANRLVNPDNQVEVKAATSGPTSIESAVEEEMSVPEVLRALLSYGDKYQAAVLGCFGDPGLRAARELVNYPVIGPAESSIYFSQQIGDRFGILVALPRDIPTTRAMVARYEMTHKLAAIQPLSIPVLALAKNREKTKKELIRAAKLAEKQGAECLILGCMSLAFILADELVQDNASIPILNPAKIALRTAETFGAMRVMHSRKTYPAADYGKLRKSIFKTELGQAA
jgi:allantoin racemase